MFFFIDMIYYSMNIMLYTDVKIIETVMQSLRTNIWYAMPVKGLIRPFVLYTNIDNPQK